MERAVAGAAGGRAPGCLACEDEDDEVAVEAPSCGPAGYWPPFCRLVADLLAFDLDFFFRTQLANLNAILESSSCNYKRSEEERDSYA